MLTQLFTGRFLPFTGNYVRDQIFVPGGEFSQNDHAFADTGMVIKKRFDFASGQVKRFATFDKLPFWLSASPDGKSVLYEHLDQQNSHVMLLENFH